jgi:hypothetical protein
VRVCFGRTPFVRIPYASVRFPGPPPASLVTWRKFPHRVFWRYQDEQATHDRSRVAAGEHDHGESGQRPDDRRQQRQHRLYTQTQGGGGAGNVLPGARSQETRHAVITALIGAAVSNVTVDAPILNNSLNNPNLSIVCLNNVLNQNDIALVENVLNNSPILSGNRDVLINLAHDFLNNNNIPITAHVLFSRPAERQRLRPQLTVYREWRPRARGLHSCICVRFRKSANTAHWRAQRGLRYTVRHSGEWRRFWLTRVVP